MRVRVMVVLAALGVLASACGSGDDASPPLASGSGRGGLSYGEAAMPEDADRTIEVAGLDSMAFEPESVTIAQGEVVTFVVTNEGKILHEFTLGDEAQQDAHEAEMSDEMASGMGSHDHPYSVMVDPGETKEITWRFTEPGDFLYGCHVPGHYAAGMVGSITVE